MSARRHPLPFIDPPGSLFLSHGALSTAALLNVQFIVARRDCSFLAMLISKRTSLEFGRAIPERGSVYTARYRSIVWTEGNGG